MLYWLFSLTRCKEICALCSGKSNQVVCCAPSPCKLSEHFNAELLQSENTCLFTTAWKISECLPLKTFKRTNEVKNWKKWAFYTLTQLMHDIPFMLWRGSVRLISILYVSEKQHLKQRSIFFIFTYLRVICMCTIRRCAVPMEARRGLRWSWIYRRQWVTWSGYWESNPGPRQEHQVLLTTEPSFQSLKGVIRGDPL